MSHTVEAVDSSWVLENTRLSRSCIVNVCIVIRQSVKVGLQVVLESTTKGRIGPSWTKSLNTNDFSQAWKATSSLKGWWKLLDIRWARDNVDGSVSTVEARAMLEGLKIAWVRGFRQVEVESDNALLVDILRNGLAGTNSVVEVRMIHTWVSKNLQVRYKLISIDSNRLADCITNEATGN
ncbi:hypothetical protein Gotri_019352 [Gossypium trilobum]|uniref:RNase H type-1 domain-containing protein n=1 Tax=Gossypium trilobum TaxID=34281 RepID=A0A7J9EDA8_9ROSI|nr:hypothetical protein [Gossypium trilobum]